MRQVPILAGVAAAALFGGSMVRHFESLAARDIKSKLSGDHAEVKVRTVPHGLLGHLEGNLDRVTITAKHFTASGLPLFTEPDRSTRGRARKVIIALEDFNLSDLRIDSLDATIPECRYDLGLAERHGKIRLSRSGTGEGSVTILASDLEKFILAKFHEIKRVTVHLNNGRVTVEGYGEFIVVKANFRVDAQLIASSPTQLSLADTNIMFDDKPATDDAAAALLQTLNPVVDLDKDLRLFGAIQVDHISLENDRLVASGATTIPQAPPLPVGEVSEASANPVRAEEPVKTTGRWESCCPKPSRLRPRM